MGACLLAQVRARPLRQTQEVLGGKNTGRRFLGCPMEEVEQQCQFVEWVDPEWPRRKLQETMAGDEANKACL